MFHKIFPFGLGVLCLVTACGGSSNSSSPLGESSVEPPSEQVTGSQIDRPSENPQGDDAQSSLTESDQANIQASQEDTLIVPGEKAGPITPETDRADLANLYGEAALEDTEIPVGEGFTESGTEINADTPEAISITWVDERQATPATVKDLGTAWQTPEGIRIGMSFAELEDLLGPFDLYGFGWDYGGTVVLEGSDLSNYYGSLILRLRPRDPSVFQSGDVDFAAVQGDHLLSSDNPNLPALDLVVGEMIVYLTPPAP